LSSGKKLDYRHVQSDSKTPLYDVGTKTYDDYDNIVLRIMAVFKKSSIDNFFNFAGFVKYMCVESVKLIV